MKEIITKIKFCLMLYCLIGCSMILLITSMFTSNWMNVSRNGTIYNYGLSLYCINGISKCYDIKYDHIRFREEVSLNLLKILVVICLALHIVLLFEVFILSKVKRKLLLHAIIITSSFTLLGIKLIVTTSFGFHIMATAGYKIDWSFWMFFISTLFCLFVLLLTLFKSLGHPKSFSKEDMTNNIVSIDYKTVTYIENDRKNMQKNYTDSYILSKYGSCLIAPSHDHR